MNANRGPDGARRRARRLAATRPANATPRSMSSFAFVFPGQGSQSVGMGRALIDASPAAAAVFATADEALGEPISSLAFEGPEDQLNRTENAQPALLATSIAYLAAAHERATHDRHDPAKSTVLRRPLDGPVLARWSPRARSTLPDGVRLVRERGRLMQASGSGRDGRHGAPSSASTTPSSPELVRARLRARRCSRSPTATPPARSWCPASAPPSRPRPRSRRSSARSEPSCCPSASPPTRRSWPRPPTGMRARPRVGRRSASPPPPLLANADAGAILDGDGAARRARRAPHGRASTGSAPCERMTADGVDTFLEVGPGKVLTNLIKRIVPDATAIALDDVLAGRRHRPAVPRPDRTRHLGSAEPGRTAHLIQGAPSVRSPDHTRRVAVTGLGVVSPVGNDLDTAWNSLTEGHSGLDDADPLRSLELRAPSSAGEVRTSRRPHGWTPRPCAAASARCTTASPPRSRP